MRMNVGDSVVSLALVDKSEEEGNDAAETEELIKKEKAPAKKTKSIAKPTQKPSAKSARSEAKSVKPAAKKPKVKKTK